ncbi:suppressor of tumorigenicity 14 protein homolog isoform X1 [Chiloscyllium plagiosum]|uniref:suppressor of tumorigenicity 14 protein homolog isoform X1 n=1 Tax=Chiloscyllium plagiosum TaxID=36176 RepID=UPI001CB87DAF|nr:suppressor of tumorigenicity 14 protein homolog isoform X1 [Chiloscyllium plagiosum]
MAVATPIPMIDFRSNSAQMNNTEETLLPEPEPSLQEGRNRQWNIQCCRETYNRNIRNKIKSWKCKVLIVLSSIILITTIVILGIKATSYDDDFIDPKLKIYGISQYYIGRMTREPVIPHCKNYSLVLKNMLWQLYNKSPAIGYYFVDSGVFSCSNVTTYFWLQFALPKEHDLLIKYTLSVGILLNVLRQHLYLDGTAKNMEVVPSSVTLQVANDGYVRSLKTGQCVLHVLLLSKEKTFGSLRLGNCSKNNNTYWLVQGQSDHSIKTVISTEAEGSVCTDVNVTMYNTWIPDSKQTVSKFRQSGLSITNEIIISGNMLLITFSSTEECDLSQYSITFLQVTVTECGGILGGMNGSFTSPSYLNNHQEEINCTWNLKVQEHFRTIIFFKEFRLGGSSGIGESCVADYLEVDGQRFCGDHKPFSLLSNSSSLQINFHSKKIYTQYFAADYIATNSRVII